MSKQSDEADKLSQGKLSSDPRHNVRPIGLSVPRVYTVKELLIDADRRLGEPEHESTSCKTGHYELDRITGGFLPGFTWLMGATSSWGKSSWLVSVADENIRAGKRVLIVSSEDPVQLYADRLLLRRTRIAADKLRRKKDLTDDDRRASTAAVAGAQDSPVYVDARRYPVEELTGHLGKIIREQKIDLVAFDYVQEFMTRRRYQDERIKFKEIASALRNVAKDHNISGILFSQLTTDDKTKVPTRNNIRDCRDMANAAEVIVLGFIPGEDIVTERKGAQHPIADKGSRCLFVDKVKNGPRAKIVQLAWDEDSATFNAVDKLGPITREREEQAEYLANEHDAYEEARYP